jgi:hypothetical protein
MRPTCVFTVASDRNSLRAISVFDSPLAISTSTSRSRSVSASSTAASRSSPPPSPRNRLSSRLVTEGDTTASPLATARSADTRSPGGVSFSRNPDAPLRNADNAYSSRSNVVITSTFAVPASAIRLVASTPSSTGMRTSISTTSGRSRSASCTASSPLAASPTTSTSSCAPSTIRKPIRMSSWSSTSSTRITPSLP